MDLQFCPKDKLYAGLLYDAMTGDGNKSTDDWEDADPAQKVVAK
jgi:hypothetical protein